MKNMKYFNSLMITVFATLTLCSCSLLGKESEKAENASSLEETVMEETDAVEETIVFEETTMETIEETTKEATEEETVTEETKKEKTVITVGALASDETSEVTVKESEETVNINFNEHSKAYDSYLEIVESNREGILCTNGSYDGTVKSVSLIDITKDGIPELFILTSEDSGPRNFISYLDIYHYDNDNENILAIYHEKIFEAVQNPNKGTYYLSKFGDFIIENSPVYYMEPKTFIGKYEYDPTANTLVCISNADLWIGEGNELIYEYTINDVDVSESDYHKTYDNLLSETASVILNNDGNFDKPLSFESTCGMTYDEAVNILSR